MCCLSLSLFLSLSLSLSLYFSLSLSLFLYPLLYSISLFIYLPSLVLSLSFSFSLCFSIASPHHPVACTLLCLSLSPLVCPLCFSFCLWNEIGHKFSHLIYIWSLVFASARKVHFTCGNMRLPGSLIAKEKKNQYQFIIHHCCLSVFMALYPASLMFYRDWLEPKDF